MDVVVILFVLAAVFVGGYAFRGFIGKEVKAAAAELKAIVADFKAEVAKVEAAVKADASVVEKKL
jgi:hypothetical protein